jgi:DNA invertase Pin-like site-specific DNA recombinase
MCKPITIAYYRVSTQKQGQSGLGLEGQQQAVKDYTSKVGASIIAVYQEVESGKRNDRPELKKALAHAKRSGATLVIAKLDRLARNVHFVSGLMESGVDFVACDNPHANKLTIHILAAVAEDEAHRISERTKSALAAYKARGGLMGAARPNGRKFSKEDSLKGGQEAATANAQKAIDAYSDIAPQIIAWRETGKSLQAIAKMLNELGHTTRRGKPWSHVQVLMVYRRFKKLVMAGA